MADMILDNEEDTFDAATPESGIAPPVTAGATPSETTPTGAPPPPEKLDQYSVDGIIRTWNVNPNELKVLLGGSKVPNMDQKLKDAKDEYERRVSEMGKSRAIASMFSMLGHLAVGMYGIKNGVNLSGMKFDATDWTAEYNQIMDRYKMDRDAASTEMEGFKDRRAYAMHLYQMANSIATQRKQEALNREKFELDKKVKTEIKPAEVEAKITSTEKLAKENAELKKELAELKETGQTTRTGMQIAGKKEVAKIGATSREKISATKPKSTKLPPELQAEQKTLAQQAKELSETYDNLLAIDKNKKANKSASLDTIASSLQLPNRAQLKEIKKWTYTSDDDMRKQINEELAKRGRELAGKRVRFDEKVSGLGLSTDSSMPQQIQATYQPTQTPSAIQDIRQKTGTPATSPEGKIRIKTTKPLSKDGKLINPGSTGYVFPEEFDPTTMEKL